MRTDMTQGAEWKQILLFSLPIMAGNLLQQLYNTVDSIVVGNFVSPNALSAVGGCFPLIMVFLAVAIGLGNGSGIVIAQLFGARRMDEIKSAVSTALIMLVGVGAALTVFGLFATPWLAETVLNIADQEILDYTVEYFLIYSGGLVFQYAYNTIAAILRAVGDSKATLIFLCVSAVINLVLDLLFVLVFRWKVVGVAVATVAAQLVCAIVSYVYMVRRYEMFRFRRREFVWNRGKALDCLRMGIPSTLQQCVVACGNVFIQRLVNFFGPDTMAAFTVGNRLDSYILVPIFGFNTGLATFAGQNTGAMRYDRIRRGWRGTMLMSVGICVAVSALAYAFAPQLARLFGVEDGGEAFRQSIEYVRFMCCFFVLFSIYMPTNGILQGAGDVLFASLCTLSTLLTRVACAYLMAYVLHLGYASIWQAMPFGWTAALLVTMPRYFSGKWMGRGIKHSESMQKEVSV